MESGATVRKSRRPFFVWYVFVVKRNQYWFLLLSVAVLIAYWPAMNGGVLWDDPGHITRPDLRPLHGLWRIWAEMGATQQYYPLLHSAFWIEHRLWGDAMFGYHLANVVLHSTAAILLVHVLRQLDVPGAMLAGFVFALHPVCVESVAWISEQKNTLSAVFYLASALVYLRGSSLTAFALFLCALLTKTVTATLPAALLLVVWWKRGRLTWKSDVVPLVPWFPVAIAAGLYTAWFEREIIGARGEDFSLTLVEQVLLAGRVVWFYLGKLLWPVDLMFWYPRWAIDSADWRPYLFPAAALGLTGALALLARRNRTPLAAFLFFCGTLVPVLGFFDVYPFRFSYVADHFQYLASLGIIVPFAAVLTLLCGSLQPARRRVAHAAIGVLVAALAVLTSQQSAMYVNAETLYRESIRRNPDAWIAYQNLGTLLVEEDSRVPEAISAYRAAFAIGPKTVRATTNVVMALIKGASRAPNTSEGLSQAVAYLEEALRIDPKSAEAHYVFGNVLALSGLPERLRDAIAHYEAALRIRPAHFRTHYNLGTLLMDVPERQAEAIAQLESAVRLEPDSLEAHVNLGMALANHPTRQSEAIPHLELALARRPDLDPVRETLAHLERARIEKR